MKKILQSCCVCVFWALGCGSAPSVDGPAAGSDPNENTDNSSAELSYAARCTSDSDCKTKTNYCKFRDGTCGGIGVCAVRPDACTQVYAPVCGCDGRTYSNACQAAILGVSVVHSGACGEGKRCGGFGGIPCPKPGVCVDDPSDECNPNNGDSDCIGICL